MSVTKADALNALEQLSNGGDIVEISYGIDPWTEQSKDYVDALETLRDCNERLWRSHDRYEYLRRLNPRQFAELYRANIRGEGAFDDLVDRRIAESK